VHAIQRESVQVPLWDELRSIGCPVLVVGGRRDGVLTPEDAARYRNAGVADLRIVWLEGFLRGLEQPPAPSPGR
jgi:pimeloyl-ACP methyl ester carboxylesterase